MSVKERIGPLLVPVARFWIRYVRLPFFKRSLWDNFHWRNRDYVVRTQFGSRVRGRTSDLIEKYIYYFGIWEPHVSHWIRNRLAQHRDRVFVDVGANIGYYTLLAAKELSAGGHVVAIEASPLVYRSLVNNVALNGFSNVRTVCCAAMAKKGPVALYSGDPHNIGTTTTVPGLFSDEQAMEIVGEPLSTILDAEETPRVRIIKIDVEGAEWSVIEGLWTVFDKLPEDVEFVMEISPEKLRLQNTSPDRVVEVFQEAGFHTYSVHNSYADCDYLSPEGIRRPQRLRVPIDRTIDVIFSRIDAEHL